MRFNSFDIDAFLRDHWQKRPLVIRDPWQAWSNPLEPDDLAGLACEDGVEARLVRRKRKSWAVEHGPFAAKRFPKLGDKRWTLLVQAVDHVVPAVAALIAPFRFVPNWRIDDVMVSYATDGGGVGPHFDQYDVFLVQGLGQRRWQVGAKCNAATPLLPHDDLRLLASFEAADEWLLDPGDILYIPPGIAHNGIAVGGDCMTYSIGFRAPSRSELIAHWCDHVLAGLDEDDRYSDPDLTPRTNPGEISAKAVARLHAMVTETMLDRAAFARWFGAYSSTPKSSDGNDAPEIAVEDATIRAGIADCVPIDRSPGSRFSFVEQADGVTLFVDGEVFDCAGSTSGLARQLCARDQLTISPDIVRSNPAMALLKRLFSAGCLSFVSHGE